MADKPKDLTSKQKNALRLGACASPVCSFECATFAYTGSTNGFRICVCGHTQNVHQRGLVK